MGLIILNILLFLVATGTGASILKRLDGVITQYGSYSDEGNFADFGGAVIVVALIFDLIFFVWITFWGNAFNHMDLVLAFSNVVLIGLLNIQCYSGFAILPELVRALSPSSIKFTYVKLVNLKKGMFQAEWQMYLSKCRSTSNLGRHARQVEQFVAFCDGQLDPSLAIKPHLNELTRATCEMAWTLERVEGYLRRNTKLKNTAGTDSARRAFGQLSDRLMVLLSEWQVAGGAARPEIREKLRPTLLAIEPKLTEVQTRLTDLETQVRLLPSTLGAMNDLSNDQHLVDTVTVGLTEVNELLAPIRPMVMEVQPPVASLPNVHVLPTVGPQSHVG